MLEMAMARATMNVAGHTIVPIPTMTGRVHLIQGESGAVLVDALTTRFSRAVLSAVRQSENGQPGSCGRASEGYWTSRRGCFSPAMAGHSALKT